jgi:hypothetical protein
MPSVRYSSDSPITILYHKKNNLTELNGKDWGIWMRVNNGQIAAFFIKGWIKITRFLFWFG